MPKSKTVADPQTVRKRLSKSGQAVVDVFEENPKATAETVARVLEIPISAAKKRIQRLLRAEAVSVQYVVSPAYSRLSANAIISVRIAHNLLTRKQKPTYRGIREFTQFLGAELHKAREWASFWSSRNDGIVVIRGAYSVAGAGLGTDIIVHVEGTTEDLLRDFVTDVLARLDGVVETNTAAVAHRAA